MKPVRVLLLLGSIVTFAHSQNPGAGSIEGTVVNLATAAPINGATVQLRGPYKLPLYSSKADTSVPQASVQSNDRGLFVFAGLAPGAYTLTADRPGYAPGFIGSLSQQTAMLTVSAGRPVKNLMVELVPYSIVTGRVLDEDGAPIQGATVTPSPLLRNPGGRTVVMGLGRGVQTDDRGIYRISNLNPDTYSLVAAPPLSLIQAKNRAGRGYAQTYYGDVADPAQAASFKVGMAEKHTADFKLKTGAVCHIRGRLIGPNGLGRGPGSFWLVAKDGSISGTTVAGIVTENQRDGTFEISGVPPGAYTAWITVAYEGENLVASRTFDLTGDVEGALIPLSPARRFSGKVEVERGSQIDLHGVSVTVHPLNNLRMNSAAQRVEDDGAFQTTGLLPTPYAVTMICMAPNCYVKSVLYGGKEVPASGVEPDGDVPLLITLSTLRSARLEVAVTDAGGKPAARSRVSVIPLDGPAMSAQTRTSDQDSRSVFEAIRPGKYLVTAWEAFQSALSVQSLGVDSLKPMEAWSKTITLEPGSEQSIQLTAVSAAETRKAFAVR